MERVTRALALSAAQLALLESGDVDAYLIRLDAQEDACAEAVEAARAGIGGDDFSRLVALNASIETALAAARVTASERLAALQRARAGQGAYLAAPPPPPLTLHEA